MRRTLDYIWREKRLRWGNFLLLAIVGAAMAALIVLVWGAVSAERAEREQVRATDEILIALRDVSRASLRGETGQRGYFITLDRRYLAAYDAGRSQIGPALERLRQLVGESPTATARQRELVDEIDTLGRAKFAELDASVALLREGRIQDARREVLTDEGIEVMNRLQRAIRELEATERRELLDASRRSVAAEALVVPMLVALLALLAVTMVLGSWLVSRAARAEAEAAQASALEEARDRADLLAKELNHRVKNLFAVILAIVQMSARDKPEAKPVTDAIAQRIHALLTAHEVSQGDIDRQVASLGLLVETTLAPYISSTHPATLDGPEVLLPTKRITPLGLVLHELTTNAVKYGAWARGGAIAVSWTCTADRVDIVWRETGAGGAPAEDTGRRGFGSLLMASAARQLGGTIARDFTPDGLVATISLPLG